MHEMRKRRSRGGRVEDVPRDILGLLPVGRRACTLVGAVSRANDMAYPCTCEEPYTTPDGVVVGMHSTVHGGLTIREYYAGLAMQGMLANSDRGPGTWYAGGDLQRIALDHADALIAQLAKALP